MSLPVSQRTFAGGEITPAAWARSDLALYEKSAKTLRNMICMRHGGVVGRPGTMYVGTTLNGGNQVRLIPFIFNETGIGQSYVLEFGNEYIAFYQNGGVVITAPNTPYTIVTPYLQADLQALKFIQSADVITITHQNYAVRELRRTSAISWQLVEITNWGSNVSVPTHNNTTILIQGTSGSDSPTDYQVTSVDAQGQESDPGVANFTLGNVDSSGFSSASLTTPITLSWDAVAGAVSYRVYASLPGQEGTFGFIGSTTLTQFTDTGITPDFTNLYPQYTQLFGADGSGNCPAVCGFSQQRRYFANPANNPIGFWGSQPGLYNNFDVHITSNDGDAIFASVAGEEVNNIQAITELKFMLMLTTGAEIYVQGNGNGVVTPSAINASVQSQYGCSNLRPLKVSDVLLFNQALGSFIRDFAFDFAIDGYRGNDITIFAAHLFEGHQIVDWGYQKIPDSIVWVVRDDGMLLGLTYIREQEILAWHHHDFQNGFVENICSIPENGSYAVYVSIRRVINGATVRYIERLSSRIWSDQIDATYLDSFAVYDGRSTSLFESPAAMGLGGGAIVITTGVNDGLDIELISDGSLYQAIIPPGTYNSTTLFPAVATAMNAALNESFAVNLQLINGILVTVISNGGTLVDLLLDSIGPNYARSIGPTLGFNPSQYEVGEGSYAAAQNMIPFFVQDSTAYKQQLALTLTNNVSFFTPQMVGDQIFLEDSLWISSQGQEGNQIKCTIQQYISPDQALVTPNRAVPLSLQNITLDVWAHAVKTVSGLSYLEGQQVSVWADRFLVGSPLNSHIDTVYTVTDGSITLDKPYAVIYVGLPMIQDVETLDLETYFGATLLGKRKRTAGLRGYLYQTRNFYAGSENPDTNNQNTTGDPLFQMSSLKLGVSTSNYDQPPPLVTKQDYVITNAQWNKSGSLFLRNVDPVPFGLLAISPNSEISEQTPYYRP